MCVSVYVHTDTHTRCEMEGLRFGDNGGKRKKKRDFPGAAVGKNLPDNAGDTGSSPGPGRSHMPWSN